MSEKSVINGWTGESGTGNSYTLWEGVNFSAGLPRLELRR